jgi:protein disulfide-isomerase A6
MQATVLLGLLAGAHAGAMELTKGNFDELVVNSGKGAFVKFLAPW